MEAKGKAEINKCECKDGKPVKSYCEKCKVYLCSDCRVAKHMDHEKEIMDLSENCISTLAEYQKLSRSASLMVDIRQVHIKDEKIATIVGDIQGKVAKLKKAMQVDVKQ